MANFISRELLPINKEDVFNFFIGFLNDSELVNMDHVQDIYIFVDVSESGKRKASITFYLSDPQHQLKDKTTCVEWSFDHFDDFYFVYNQITHHLNKQKNGNIYFGESQAIA